MCYLFLHLQTSEVGNRFNRLKKQSGTTSFYSPDWQQVFLAVHFVICRFNLVYLCDGLTAVRTVPRV